MQRQGFPLKQCTDNNNTLCPDMDLKNAVDGAQFYTMLKGKAFQPNSVAYILRLDDCSLKNECQNNRSLLQNSSVVLYQKSQYLFTESDSIAQQLTGKPGVEEMWQPSLYWKITNKTQQATVSLQRNLIKYPQSLGAEQVEYYTSASTHLHEQAYYDMATQGLIVFQVDRTFTQTTAVPRYQPLSLIESFGGFAVLIWWVAKFFVSVIEGHLLESELISTLYQV